MVECALIFFNDTFFVSSLTECNYYNYHMIWALLIAVVGFIMCVQYMMSGTWEVNRWGALWMVFLFFGLEIGSIAGCLIASCIKHRPTVDEDSPVAETIPVIESGIPIPMGEVAFVADALVAGEPLRSECELY